MKVSETYSQTYSNKHLYKTTTHLRWPVPSPPKQIPIQSLLYKTTTCLTWSATTFYCLPNEKKTCLKQPLQNFTHRRNRKQWYGNNAQKVKVSLIIFTLLLLHNATFLKTGRLHLTFVFTISQDKLFLYSLQVAGAYLNSSRTFMMELFCKNS